MTVTQKGGTIRVGAFTFTESHRQLEPLPVGSECIFLLRQKAGRYDIEGDYFGAFKVDGAKTYALAVVEGFASELAGATPEFAAQEILRLRSQSRK